MDIIYQGLTATSAMHTVPNAQVLQHAQNASGAGMGHSVSSCVTACVWTVSALHHALSVCLDDMAQYVNHIAH